MERINRPPHLDTHPTPAALPSEPAAEQSFITATAATQMIGCSSRALGKLADAGLIDTTFSDSGRRTLYSELDCQEIAAFTPADIAALGDIPLLAVHVNGPTYDPVTIAGFVRTDAGYAPGIHHNSWTGWWPMTGETAASFHGGLIVPSLGGFVPQGAVRWIVGHDIVSGRVAFTTEAVDDATASRLTGARFKAAPGNIWQRLN